MNCEQINNIPFSHIFDKIGIKPTKRTHKENWYLSPFRNERTASFKVNLKLNRFHDFGIDSKGTLVDFWCKYKSCDVKTTIKEISNMFSFPEQRVITKPIIKSGIPKHSAPKFKILEIRPLSINILKNYLTQRGLSERINSYIQEVHFEINGRRNFAIGFMNDSGGFELRNRLFQGCSSKAITSHIIEGSSTLILFEGFIDFLSYIERTAVNGANGSFIILNSLAMIQKAKPFISQFKKVKLFLDNDQAGRSVTEELSSEFSNIIDKSPSYSQFKDYNDFHVNSLLKI